MKLFGVSQQDKQLYVDDVFSTYLYTSTGATQTIENGIDLAGEGGLVWVKQRSNNSTINTYRVRHKLSDSVRGSTQVLCTDGEDASINIATGVTAFNSDGFSLGDSAAYGLDGDSCTSWTFRRAPKFFDIVTYTGDGVAGRQIPHDLGVAPGMMIVKVLNDTNNWVVYHRGVALDAETDLLYLNTTTAVIDSNIPWDDTAPTDSHFTVGDHNLVNGSGYTYVAYLFAHDPEEDGWIQCGSYVGNGSADGPEINLGWEPQWLLIKGISATNSWCILDTVRDMSVSGIAQVLFAHSANAEYNSGNAWVAPTATGFQLKQSYGYINTNGNTFIYMAIRRPNKPPKSATEVYTAIARTGNTIDNYHLDTIPHMVDTAIIKLRTLEVDWSVNDRLRGGNRELNTAYTAAEATGNVGVDKFDSNTGVYLSSATGVNNAAYTYINHFLRRTPGFFDVVCYTGVNGSNTVNHNLGVIPELVIIKNRTSTGSFGWAVWSKAASSNQSTGRCILNTDGIYYTTDTFFQGLPSDTSFSFPSVSSDMNWPDDKFVAYLFATLPGISKVGSYVGNGTSQTIDCGFSTGARFILIKRTDATGDWFLWDTARGIVAANDPHLSLNTTVAEVTTDDSVDPDTSGFIVNQVAATNINVTAGEYIFLAIA